jgi:glycosyltransferase involved in cell wall biosynthesis
MRIGIDGFNLALRRGTGVATYARVLASTVKSLGLTVDGIYGVNIAEQPDQYLREAQFFSALFQDESRPKKLSLRRRLKRACLSSKPRKPQEIVISGQVFTNSFDNRLPSFDRIFNLGSLFSLGARYFKRFGKFLPLVIPSPPDIMHWTYPLPIQVLGSRNIYTVHDLVPLRLPQTTNENHSLYRELLRHCIGSGHIVTVSETARADILALCPESNPAQVTNTYQAAEPWAPGFDLSSQSQSARLRDCFGLQADGYFLYFGALEPKKNVGRLIEGYLHSGVQTPLVIVGETGWRNEDELWLVSHDNRAAVPALSRIRRIPYLPRDLLMLLVSGAKAVTFPALYEGFGLPVLEAMSRGTAVLTSIFGAVREIAGDAALFVDPYDVQAIASAIMRLDQDPTMREELKIAGRKRAQLFTQDIYGARLRALYQQIAGVPVAGTATYASPTDPAVRVQEYGHA